MDVAPASTAGAVLKALTAHGRGGLYFEPDVSNEESVNKAIGEVIRQFGGVDVLVNNAGIVHEALVENLDAKDWDRVLGVNLRGTFPARAQSCPAC